MIPWVIAALVLVSLVLLAACVILFYLLHEERENVDLVTRTLLKFVDRDARDLPAPPPERQL